ELTAAISQAAAFVQIVSPTLLELPAGAMHDFRQIEAAREAQKPIFRWRAPDLDVEAVAKIYAGYKEFAGGSDVRQQLLPQFKVDLLAALKDLSAARLMKETKDAGQGGEGRLVLVTGEPPDLQQYGGRISEKLSDCNL